MRCAHFVRERGVLSLTERRSFRQDPPNPRTRADPLHHRPFRRETRRSQYHQCRPIWRHRIPRSIGCPENKCLGDSSRPGQRTPPDHRGRPEERSRPRPTRAWSPRAPRMLDYPACEMVASGPSRTHAPDYPSHTPGTISASRGTSHSRRQSRRSFRGGETCSRALFEPLWIRDQATRHELDEKLHTVGASRLSTVTSRAT